MRHAPVLPESIVRRAATVARGPHACPTCAAPTWAEPPVPWSGLRDYVVRCDACERPLAVRVDRTLVLRRDAGERSRTAGMVDPITERLDARGIMPFLWRCAAAALVPVLLVTATIAAGGGARAAMLVALLVTAPSAAFAPAVVALALARVTERARGMRVRPRTGGPIQIMPARWDQWLREEHSRARERSEQPEAVLRELERVLDDRELRRVRALAERGEVPADHLADLLRFRRSWRSVA